MKSGIHPVYKVVTVTCACGETFTTRSTKDDMRLEICAKCHPFFTGKQKLIDSAGRVERFEKRYKNAPREAVAKTPKAVVPPDRAPIMTPRTKPTPAPAKEPGAGPRGAKGKGKNTSAPAGGKGPAPAGA